MSFACIGIKIGLAVGLHLKMHWTIGLIGYIL